MHFKQILDWWREGLAAPWPRWVRSCFGPNRRRYWIRSTGDGFQILSRRGSAYHVLADIDDGSEPPETLRRRLRSSRLVYRLPREDAVVRTLTVPEHTHAGDPEYIRSMLDQISPLPADQLYTGSSPGDAGRTLVMGIAQKSQVDGQLQRLKALGIGVDAVTVDGHDNTSLNLLPTGHGRPRGIDVPGVILVIAGLALCTAGIFLAMQEQRRTLAALEHQRQTLQQEVAGGRAVRERMDALETRASAISERGAETGFALALLAAVSLAMPQHSWVRSWVLREDQLTLFGESADTSDLIARLEASPLLKNVRYDAAITRDPANGRDRYRLTAATQKQ